VLKKLIEGCGGKVVDSVSKNTFCLINNDTESSSEKNLTAKKLNIPIFTEEYFIANFLEK
jgi:NAD-dependent DNA ligase